MSAVGRRYAKAVLDLARELGQVDSVLNDVSSLAATWKESAELRDLVRNPAIPKPALKAALDAVMEKLGVSNLMRNTVKKQDPSLIGGVVTRIGDQVFDGSLSNRLSELRETLLADGETP